MLALPVAGTLPASRSHTARRWTFLPAADASSVSLGTLTITQGRRDLDSYAVEVDANESRVLLCKLEDGEIYAVEIDRAGKPVRCNCDGFRFVKTCKHSDAVRELIADDVLPVPQQRATVPATIAPSTWRPTNSPDLDCF